MGVIARIARPRGFRLVGWAYVVFWILSSGFLTAAILTEALLVRHPRSFGTDVTTYVLVLLGFPLMVPGMVLTGGHPGDTERQVAFYSATIATLAWAIVGWWTIGAAVWRRFTGR